MLQIYLLGRFQLAVDDQPVRLQGLPKIQPLLVHLLLKRGQAIDRGELTTALWPDLATVEARSNLRRHLHDLKRALPAPDGDQPWIVTTGSSVQWNPDAAWWLDAAEFERCLVHPDQWPRAVELYAGDLTPLLYDDWLLYPREYLRNQYFDMLSQLIDRLEHSGDLAAAIHYAQTALRHDPMREAVVRQLMHLRFASGDRAGALQEYHRFEQQLRAELEVAPMVETSALYDSIARHVATSVPREQPAARAMPASPPAMPVSPPADEPQHHHELAPVAPVVAPYNLPAQLTSFIGREAELAAIRTLLTGSTATVRLITITGPGGSGKSRLALEAGSRIRAEDPDAFPGGILFAPLSNLAQADQVLPTLAEIAGVRAASAAELLGSMKEYLRPRRMLWIVDNFEHVPAAAQVLRELLEAAPNLRLLVTSRTVLRIYGEQEFPLAPLAMPEPGESYATLARRAAIVLFTTRSRAVRPTFALTQENAATVAEICRQLDGLPLALELAAARSKLLPPGAMLERLRTDLALLSDPRLPPRHRTLQATLAWSFDLLGPAEQRLFMMLSALPGTFDLAAAEAVGCELEDVFGAIEALVDNSLLQQIEADIVFLGEDAALAGDEVRFRMLSLVRQYAAARLHQEPYCDAVYRRAAEFYRKLADSAELHLRGQEQGYWMRRLEVELPNIRAALQWSLASADVADRIRALRLASALTLFWYGAGHFVEAERWLQEALAQLPAASAADRAKALCSLGIMRHAQGDLLNAPPYFEASLALYRQLDDRNGVALCLYGLGRLAIRQHDFVCARQYFDESLAVAHAAGEEYHRPYILNLLAAIALAEGHYAAAHAQYEEALATARRLHNLGLIAFILTGYGELARLQGDYALAAQLYREAMTIAEELHQKPRRVMLLHNLAYVVLHNGATRQARQLFQQGLSLGMELPDRENFGMCLLGLGAVAAVEGDLERAARLFGAGEHELAAIGAALAPADQAEYDRYRALVHAALDSTRCAQLFAIGQQLSVEAMETLALS